MSQVESASGSKFLLFAITCPFVAPRLSNRMRAVNLDGGEYIRCIFYCVIQNTIREYDFVFNVYHFLKIFGIFLC